MAKSDIQEITHDPPALSSSRGSNGANGMAGASVLQTIGAILRERRETTNLSLADVEKATRIRQKYLAALEADEWHLLPGEVVGRGFLRNYASYLNLNATDLMERRRDMTDGDLARVLSKTSAGALLPPTREVDYRPKDFDLEETPISSRLSEYVATGRDWFAPIISLIAVALVVFLIFWGVREVGQEVAMLYEGVRTQVAELMAREGPSMDLLARNDGRPDDNSAGIGGGTPPTGDSNDNSGDGGDHQGSSGNDPAGGSTEGSSAVAALPAATDTPTPTATVEPPTPTPEPVEPTPTPEPVEPTPTPTATAEPPTPTPEPVEPTPTPEPVEPTPTPEPAVVAPGCPDNRSAITSPGVNQTVSGAVQVLGNATHEQFNFYKLEVAPGANAEGGFGYFAGTSAQVQGGVLGNFNSAAYANGPYTIQLTVVDATGNYPPPCRVTINVQN